MLSIFELENTHEGCGFLLLQKLLVRIADVFKATFSQNYLCQRESSVPVNIPLYSTKGQCNCESCCQHDYHHEERLGFGQPKR